MQLRTGVAAALAALSFSPAAHAVVESGHWFVNAMAPNPRYPDETTNTAIYVDQTVTGDYTGNFFTYDATLGTLKLDGYNLDEGAWLYTAQPGDLISQALVLNPGDRRMSSGLTQTVGRDFWLGVATSSLTDPGFSWYDLQNRTTFGWAHLQAQADGTLKLLDSAMAFLEPGIVVGAKPAGVVPEPGTWALMSLGLLGLATVSRRRQH
jgi:hypothetical protein